MSAGCAHLVMIRTETPSTHAGCQECLVEGTAWVHLRLCTTCGHVGCCDDSERQHATDHAREEQHPIVASLEPGERWRWCYLDEHLLPDDVARGRDASEGV